MNESGSGMRGWNAAMTRLRPIIAVAAAETGCCTMAGTMTATPDFRLYHGNALEVLAELLAETLRTPVVEDSPLQPDTILVPQVAMRRWLQSALARRHGIAANLTTPSPTARRTGASSTT